MDIHVGSQVFVRFGDVESTGAVTAVQLVAKDGTFTDDPGLAVDRQYLVDGVAFVGEYVEAIQ